MIYENFCSLAIVYSGIAPFIFNKKQVFHLEVEISPQLDIHTQTHISRWIVKNTLIGIMIRKSQMKIMHKSIVNVHFSVSIQTKLCIKHLMRFSTEIKTTHFAAVKYGQNAHKIVDLMNRHRISNFELTGARIFSYIYISEITGKIPERLKKKENFWKSQIK